MGRATSWKTFYLEGGTSDNDFIAAMEDYARHTKYSVDHQGDVCYETNIPVSELRAIARLVGKRMPEYTISDTKVG